MKMTYLFKKELLQYVHSIEIYVFTIKSHLCVKSVLMKPIILEFLSASEIIANCYR